MSTTILTADQIGAERNEHRSEAFANKLMSRKISLLSDGKKIVSARPMPNTNSVVPLIACTKLSGASTSA